MEMRMTEVMRSPFYKNDVEARLRWITLQNRCLRDVRVARPLDLIGQFIRHGRGIDIGAVRQSFWLRRAERNKNAQRKQNHERGRTNPAGYRNSRNRHTFLLRAASN